jgi:regulatory protein
VRELKQKGIDPEIIAEVTQEIDNETEAHRAGYKKALSLSGADYFDFRKKMSAFLYRRGFDYQVIKGTIELLWKEVKEERIGDG